MYSDYTHIFSGWRGGAGDDETRRGEPGKSPIMNYLPFQKVSAISIWNSKSNASVKLPWKLPWNGDHRPIACLETNVYIKTMCMHLSHKTCLSSSTRQRRICLYTFNVKCVFVSYTGLKWPLNIPVTIIQHVFWLFSYIFRTMLRPPKKTLLRPPMTPTRRNLLRVTCGRKWEQGDHSSFSNKVIHSGNKCVAYLSFGRTFVNKVISVLIAISISPEPLWAHHDSCHEIIEKNQLCTFLTYIGPWDNVSDNITDNQYYW